ncbi:hypothetical protein [Flavobacterium sp.]|jgi:hypothetical protein|uniref:hypothetical protein n=1 Tax=Flavobacterium sp. TaxID=239 RepID=UPI0037BFA8C8
MNTKRQDYLPLALANGLSKFASEQEHRALFEQSAAELRRLHSINAEFLMALKYIADQTYDPWTNGAEAQRVASAAIAKAQE